MDRGKGDAAIGKLTIWYFIISATNQTSSLPFMGVTKFFPYSSSLCRDSNPENNFSRDIHGYFVIYYIVLSKGCTGKP